MVVGVFKGAPVPIVSGCHVGGGAAGAIEVYHALCLLDRGEPLLTPDLGIGGEVTDAGSHWIRG
jgi:hypothetical protein